MKFRENILALKKYWQIIYAVVLILLIPVVIIANTVWITGQFKGNIDVQLQRQALALAEVFNGALQDEVNDPSQLQDELKRVAALNEDIRLANILVPDGEQFRVVASVTPENVGKTTDELKNVIAWHDQQAIANITNAAWLTQNDPFASREFENPRERFWSVTVPLIDEEGNKQALLNLNMSLQVVDDLVSRTLLRSYVILAVAVIVVVLLLMANTRLFQYAALAKKLKEVEKLKDEFISMASHELRTPITSIRGYLSMMKEGTMGELPDVANQKIDMMMASADRLSNLVEDLLNVSRIEQGRLNMHYEIARVEPVVQEVVDELAVRANEKDLRLEYQKPDGELPELLIDPNRVKQALVNIIGNAIKYTPGGEVILTTEHKPEDGVVEIKCSDTGLGMTQKQRKRLFTKFYRVQTEETEDIKGTGLGLWITKQIVEMMDGDILVDSIKDVGTEMTIQLPVKSEKEMEKTLEKQEEKTKEEADKMAENAKKEKAKDQETEEGEEEA